MATDEGVAGQVVIGYDGSVQAEAAARWGIRWARGRGVGVTLVAAHALYPFSFREATAILEHDEAQRAELEAFLEEARGRLQAQAGGTRVRTLVWTGQASDVLVRASHRANVVIIGTRGLGGVQGILAGGTADRVATHAWGPIIVVPVDAADDRDGPVVVGVQDPVACAGAIRFAGAAAAQLRKPLLLVHAIEPQTRDWALRDDSRETLAGEVGPLLESFAGLQVEYLIVDHSAADILVAQSEAASLVVVGSRGRGGLTGLLLGSTSRRVLRDTKGPAAVIHEH